MSEWKDCKLGDAPFEIIDGDRGKNYPKKDEFFEHGYCLFLNTKNVTNNGFAFTELNFITKGKDELLRKGKLKKYDLVLTTRGTVGNVGFYNENIAFENIRINSGMVIIRPNGIDERFNYQLFNYLKKHFGTFTTGSAQPQLPIRDLKEIPFQLPPLPEQKAIASVLSSLDDKIDLLHRQNKTLEAMAETLFRQWFVEEAQEDWKETVITELFEIRDGTHDSPKQSPVGKPLITSKHIGTNRLDIKNAYLISEDDFHNVNKRSKVETNDILFSMIGTIGLTYLEQSETVDYAIKNIGLFKASQNPDWRYYTFLWINSYLGKEFIHEYRSGSTQEYIALGSLRGIVFDVPPLNLLLEFNKVIHTYFQKIKNNMLQIHTLEKLRDTLLPKLMSGKVKVAI